MKKSTLLPVAVLLFSLTTAIHAQKVEDYPLTAHVSRTGIILLPAGEGNAPYTCVEATIEGRKLTLASNSFAATRSLRSKSIAMKIGDYKAKILKDEPINAAQYTREYEFLLPDGKKLEFEVIGESEN